MPSIAIVGAGQAGMQLALGLLNSGYNVTVVSDRSPDAIRQGSVMSTQCMFGSALAIEEELGLNQWADECPAIEGLSVAVAGPDGRPALKWQARLTQRAQSVDQRLKIPAWMELFERRGGRLLTARAGIDDLEELADRHDLVIVAAGKGPIGALFARDGARSPYDKPQRSLSLLAVHGLERDPDYDRVNFSIIPGVGEYFVMPGLTHSGPYHSMLFEAIPGGPMDCWSDVSGPEEQLARARECLERWLPWEAERAKNVTIVDAGGALKGAFAPTVRQPIAVLSSGKAILGLADTVVLNDPITGQGSNNAAKSAAVYLAAIQERGSGGFDRDWMQSTFERYWDYARYVTDWTNAMLAPPPPHVLNVLGAASQAPAIAERFVNGFDNPPSFFPWLMDPEAAGQYVAEAMLQAA